MNRKERVRTTFSHREPDRVPMFELTVANPVFQSVLGRRIMGFGTPVRPRQPASGRP